MSTLGRIESSSWTENETYERNRQATQETGKEGGRSEGVQRLDGTAARLGKKEKSYVTCTKGVENRYEDSKKRKGGIVSLMKKQ